MKAGTPYRCNTCGMWKNANSFKEKCLHPTALRTRVCTTCVETRQCRGKCKEWKEKAEFKDSEWKHAGGLHDVRGKCKKCQTYGKEKKLCSKCKNNLPSEDFGTKAWEQSDTKRTCGACRQEYGVSHKVCAGCTKKLPRSAYGSNEEWYKSDTKGRKCSTCREDKSRPGMWKCIGCGLVKSKKTDFSMWLRPNPNRKKDAYTRCNPCSAKEEEEKEQIRKTSLQEVVRKRKR